MLHVDRNFFESKANSVSVGVLPLEQCWNVENKWRIKNKRVMKLSVSGTDIPVRVAPGSILKSSCWVMWELYRAVNVPQNLTAFKIVKQCFQGRQSRMLIWFTSTSILVANPVLYSPLLQSGKVLTNRLIQLACTLYVFMQPPRISFFFFFFFLTKKESLATETKTKSMVSDFLPQ